MFVGLQTALTFVRSTINYFYLKVSINGDTLSSLDGNGKPEKKMDDLGVQWNHCLRTYCEYNFRGWIAGFNPFCQLIEIGALGYPGILATGSSSL